MNEPILELQQLQEIISKIKDSTNRLQKYKGHPHYKKKHNDSLSELNRSYTFLRAKIGKTDKAELIDKFSKIDSPIKIILSDAKPLEKLESIKALERYWPDLEIEFANLRLGMRSFEIPKDLPMTEYKADIDEAIKDFDNECFISSLVLCRRAYEGALVALYRAKKGEPVEEVRCKSCDNIVRSKAYMGIAKLHNWAIESGIITEKMKQVGFLLTDMGAGAAHPPLTEFPRNKEMARLGITATLALLEEIHKKQS